MLLEGLARQFNDRKRYQVVGRATTGAEALLGIPAVKPDVVTLDLSLPDINGMALIPRLLAVCPDARILVLTMHDHERYARGVLAAGARGYLPKGAPFGELEQAVEILAAGGSYLPLSVQGTGAEGAARSRGVDALSEREFAMLTLLARGLSVKESSSELGISDKTASTYRARMMKKMGLSRNADLVQYAIENGLIESLAPAQK